ncbi:MAG: hypothetical protein ACYDCS_08510 [Candidatus Dormibacteria bacterium]
MKVRSLLLTVMLISTPLAGCASNSGLGTGADTDASSLFMSTGASAPYDLYTHCGVLSASINGHIFYAEPALTDGSGNPPRGWGNPYDGGEMTLRSVTTADFRDPAGHSAHFARQPQGPGVATCS